jgi:nuclear transport factor 2 (NTF2) superfamily protein/pimeloyl-ACP methyl ester carboxylesterase
MMRFCVLVALAASLQLSAQSQGEVRAVEHPTSYRTIQIDGLSIFYREAGPKNAPVLVLLHGLPSSSRMFEPLFARLADSYHLVAPDYPGFGHSDWPDPKNFAYTFDRYAGIMNHFTEALGLSRYTLYMQDYGGPVGFRMALAHPERVQALIVQDAVAHNEGLGVNWATRRAFWADRPAQEAALRENLLSLASTKRRHVGDDPNIELYNPDLWTDEYAFLNAPGQAQIQSDLFYDYRTPAGDLGQTRCLVRSRRAGTVSQGRAQRGGSCIGRGTLRAGHQSGGDRGAGTWLPEKAEVKDIGRPPLPPFTRESAMQKVRLAEDGWNTRDPEKVALAYTIDSRWRNRAEFVNGRDEIIAFLSRKWTKELDYRLVKELWAFASNRIAVRFAYEWHDDSGHWYRSYGNENWEFHDDGLMASRFASINDVLILESDRKYRWPLGRRPDDHPGLSELGL